MKKDFSDKYQKLDQIEHCRKRPGMYIGSITNLSDNFWIVDQEEKMSKSYISYNPGILKMFDEIILNSVDEHIRSKSVDIIKVNIDNMFGEISVYDNGGIPVIKHEKYRSYIPEMIFGELLTGSNFNDDDRSGAGTHGLGAKLTNIMSEKFSVSTCDGERSFFQEFNNGMREKSKPIIKKSKNKGTKISFIPDYEYFKCEISTGLYEKIKKRVYDIAGCNPKIKVYFNDRLIKINKFLDYAKMYNDNIILDKNDDWEVGVTSSVNDTFSHISFVNNIDTSSNNSNGGGAHVDYIANQITAKLREYIIKKHKIDIKPNNIKQQLMLFINCKINAPMFTSQTKEYMSTDVKDFGTDFEVSDKFINKIIKSEVVQRVLDWAQAQQRQKELAALRKLEKKKKVHKSDKYFPATKNKKILIAGEGQSALGGLIPSLGRENIGYYELKGKPLNCFNASVTKFKDNKELAELYSILNNEGYEYFIVGADQDLDGFHIRLLLASFIMEYVPEMKGKFGYLDTPVMVIKKNGKITRWSYSLRDQIELKRGEELQYYKGLGTWDFKDLKYIVQQDGIETMIKLFDFSDIEPYTNWLKGDRVETRKEELSQHLFNIANL